MTENKSFNKILENSFKTNWNFPALSDYRGNTLYYRDVALKIEKLHIVFEAAGLKPDDKVALCSRNQAHWGVCFLAAITYGAVPVPIMHEFKSSSIHFLVNHSEAKILFVGSGIWEGLSQSEMPGLACVVRMEDFSLLGDVPSNLKETYDTLNVLFGQKFPRDFDTDSINYYSDKPEELALINYTSGTSGFSKGVMIPYRALYSNYLFAEWSQPQMKSGENVVAMLPSAHMYGMMYEFLFPIAKGGHVHFLTRLPTPKIIKDSMAELKPSYVISVPLVIEKIYKKQLEPIIRKYGLKYLLHFPFLEKAIKTRIVNELDGVFGNHFSEIIIGGAAFNKEAEAFFKSVGFRYTVGYGMTECAPIIAYARWNEQKLFSCGKAAPRMEIKIDSPDSVHVPGEILTRGDNVFLGYYKNEEATSAAFT
ncbi:MAG: AMP-binding protein, partial [Alistipes sp.]|nr:AMP-binding protein [Candidatus Minthomonas equi]